MVAIAHLRIQLLSVKQVEVEGKTLPVPQYFPGVKIEHSGLYVIVTLSGAIDLTLTWDGGMATYIDLGAKHMGEVSGLCGQYNGISADDFLTAGGDIEMDSNLFAMSWKVRPTQPDIDVELELGPCIDNPDREPWAKAQCGAITSDLFSRCHEIVDPQVFYDLCVYDACGCNSGGDCECLCTAVASYARACSDAGVHVHWRSQELCPLQCEFGFMYLDCGPSCDITCENYDSPLVDDCAAGCVEGCHCPRGMVRQGMECVFIEQCPCVYEDVDYPAGSVLTKSCQSCECENGKWNCIGEYCGLPETCPHWQYTCGDGTCIAKTKWCDTNPDCPDGSDESRC
jgi:hypothetical protein